MKGYHTRKFKIPRKKIDLQILSNYRDKMIKSTIENKIIPDIVIEILTYNKVNEDVSLYSTEYKAHLEILDRIIVKVTTQMSRFIVREATDNIVNNIVKKHNEQKPPQEKDPLALALRDIITNTLKKECQQIAEQSVNELSQEYLSEIHLRQLIKDKFVTKMVKENVIDSIEEIIIETMVDDMAYKLSKELSLPLANHIYEQVQQEVEGIELDKALDSYVNRGMLDIVLEQIGVMIDEKNKKRDKK